MKHILRYVLKKISALRPLRLKPDSSKHETRAIEEEEA
jgi:hypothetical protein